MAADILPDPVASQECAMAALSLDGHDCAVIDFLKHLLRKGQLRKQLSEWATNLIISREAESRGIRVSVDTLQAAADQFRRSRKLLSAAETSDWLSRQGMSIFDLEDQLEFELKSRLLFQAVTNNADQFFRNAPSLWDRITVRLIVVEKQDLAEEIRLQLLEADVEFSTLAKAHSVHPSAVNGGLVKDFFRCDLARLISSDAHKLEAAAQIGPVATDQGWLLVDVVEITPAVFDQKTETAIRRHLFQQWLSARIRQSKVSYPLLDRLACSNAS